MHSMRYRSLRRSIKAGKPCMTAEGGVDSTVHVDVEDHNLDGDPIRMFDCAGQVRPVMFLVTLSLVYQYACVVGRRLLWF